MNRYDWMKILTKGYCPPKSSNKVKKNTENPEIKNEIEVDGNIKLDESEVDNCENPDLNSSAKKKEKSKEILAKVKHEEINHFRNQNNINVSGSDIPSPIRTFDQLFTDHLVSRKIVENLLNEKYQEPTSIQKQAWSLLLKRRELLACAPTGSGKTAAFVVPIIHHLKGPSKKGFRALILAPTRELAKQIVRECDRLVEGLGLKTSVITKGKATARISLFKKMDILVTTPNRLIFLMENDEQLKKILQRIQWLIVDESDKLFEVDGKNNFRDQLGVIFSACSGPSVVRALFSATLSYDVEQWSKLYLNDPAMVSIGARNSCPDVEQSLNFCGCNAGKSMELHNILRSGYEIPCLIFVQTKERAKSLCEEILLTNRPVRTIHSDMSQYKRDEIVKEFRERKIWILICTELMSRGIDFKGVNLVINYDFPPSIVSYVHRIGRTGRAGKNGKAITFWSMDDKPLLRSVAQVMKDSGSEVSEWILRLPSTSTKERKFYAKHLPDRDADDPSAGDETFKKPFKGNKRKLDHMESSNLKRNKEENTHDINKKNTKKKKKFDKKEMKQTKMEKSPQK